MKIKLHYGVACALTLAMLATGCNSDDLPIAVENPIDRDSEFYVNVTIANPAEQGSRANDNISAGDYESGTPEEQKINKILFIFYNSANKYVGNTVITLNADATSGTTADGETVTVSKDDLTGEGSVSTLMNVVVPVSVSAGSLKPAYVMAVVNPTSDDGHEQRSLDQFIGLTRTFDQLVPSSGDIEHNGFTMSNSVYYEEIGSNKPVVAVAIPDGYLFTSSEDAASATGNNVTIYVERVVAKVNVLQKDENLSQTNNTITSYPTTGVEGGEIEYTLDFNVLGWGLSNVEKGSFVVKNFRGSNYGNCFGDDFEDAFLLSNRTWADINTPAALGGLTNPSWNYPGDATSTTPNWGISGHRSFWACSPTYFTGGNYPSYSDEVVENSAAYSLTYRSFNDIYDTKANKPGRRGSKIGSSLYTLEHTMVEEVVTNQQKRGVTCALVLGQYTIKDAAGNSLPAGTTFYIRNGVTSSGESINSIFVSDDDLKAHILSANNRIYVKNDDGTYTALNQFDKDQFENFVIEHPNKEITMGKYTPNRYVSLQLNADKLTTAGYYLRDASGVYAPITTVNMAAANEALAGLVNGVEMYNSGYAFFSIPVEHLWGRDNKKIGDDDFSAKLGQYGVVRNHIYTINVTGIDGIGTGIGDPNVPIIPNVDQEKYYVRTEMRVQRWRIVPQQNVTLRP